MKDAKTDLEVEVESPTEGSTSISGVAFNVLNTIIGSGILGLPYAVKQAGFVTGLIVLAFVGVLTDFSLRMLVKSGRQAGIYHYSMLANSTLGKVGSFFLNIFILFNGLGIAISYLIIIGDTLPLLAAQYVPGFGVLQNRIFGIVMCSIIFIFPLLFFRTLAPLAKFSAISIGCLPVICIIVAIRAPSYAKDYEIKYTVFGDNIFPAIGVMSFAYVVSHSTFLNYCTLKNPTQKRWSIASMAAVGGSAVIYLAFSAIGFASFGNSLDSNVFTNFPRDDIAINVARLCLIITMFLTYPCVFYSARMVTNIMLRFETETKTPTKMQHILVNVGLFLVTLAIGLPVKNLGTVYQLIGALCASGISYIIPALIYMSVFWDLKGIWLRATRVFRKNAPDLASERFCFTKAKTNWLEDLGIAFLLVFGIVALAAGTGGTIAQIVQGN
ncbi:hypothetical protein K493DRAFT_268405 [Basidiobolus meristosporus CBS 931.73]|uniref:Amino acid transporter transmembrane domain-containing protein n=1 Tax=Basidiobolus meristosporus CBS 931.73 TaxID=1314790 RepID=A0A1Y1XRM3_9FUNG|nr:hypothetical protein K493DRAFT_268405 [Basidiobolus meristosporus CBS 931.73]|eukprot:ORX88387.1 hypothetical protein K493DRAFT_268405 [Basidiobolus meristosporus CBS 931.73]